MEPPVHKTVFIAPKKKRVVTGHGKPKTGSCSNASIIRRIHSYDIVTRVPDDDRTVASAVVSPSPSLGADRMPSSSADIEVTVSSPPMEVVTVVTTDKPEADIISDSREAGDEVIQDRPPVLEGDRMMTSSDEGGYLTLTGTIRRGKRAGQSIDVTLNMSREELEKMESELVSRAGERTTSSGVHVFAFSVLVMPIVLLAATCYAFYWGTFAWYNVYLHFSEERGVWHRVLVCPLLVLTYPLWVAPVSLAVGTYAALAQLSWRYDRWRAEVQDLEKGFFGWACAALHLVDCAPYQVVVLNDVPVDAEKVNIKSKHDHVDTTTV